MVIDFLSSPDAGRRRSDRSLRKAFPIQTPSQVSDRPHGRAPAPPAQGRAGISPLRSLAGLAVLLSGKICLQGSQRFFTHRIDKGGSRSHLKELLIRAHSVNSSRVCYKEGKWLASSKPTGDILCLQASFVLFNAKGFERN